MIGRWLPWLMPACVLAVLAAGCGSPATFSVETVVHPDGSCDRTICQPRDEFLPDEALEPEWIARWKSVDDASGPPGSSPSGASAGKSKYFIGVRLVPQSPGNPAPLSLCGCEGPGGGCQRASTDLRAERLRLRRRAPLEREDHQHRDPARIPRGCAASCSTSSFPWPSNPSRRNSTGPTTSPDWRAISARISVDSSRTVR